MKKLSPTLEEFCRKQELLRMAFVDRHGQPRVVPVWFVIFELEYYVGTGVESVKWKAIKREPRVGWVIDGGTRDKYKGVSMFGTAQEVTDKKLRAEIYRALAEKYFGSVDDPKHVEIWGEVDAPGSVYIRLNVEDGFWWEY